MNETAAVPQGTPRSAIVQVMFGATIISFSPVFVKIANVEPTMAGFYRCLFGGVFLLLFAWVRRDSLWKGARPFFFAVACGALFAADLSFWHRAIAYVGPGLSTILGNFQVFFLSAWGVFVLRERVGWRFAVSIPVALTGLFLLVGIDWNTVGGHYRLGVLFGVITAITYAAFMLVLRKSRAAERRLSASANLAVISLVTAAIMIVEGLAQGESLVIPDRTSMVSMVAYGVLCQAVGWIVISRALPHVPTTRAGLILLLQPTLAFIWDILFFGRPTGVWDVVGAALALGAIYLGTARKS